MNGYRLNQYRPRTDEARINTDEALRSMRTAERFPTWKKSYHERSGRRIEAALVWGTVVLLGVAFWIMVVVYP